MEPKKKTRQPGEPAWLPSAGLDEKRATLHEFVRLDPLAPEDLKYSAEHGPRSTNPAYAVIYRCTETGAERRWGVQ